MHYIWVARLVASLETAGSYLSYIYICLYVCLYIIPSIMHNSIIKQQLEAMAQTSVPGLISNGITN
jgi:hypothetical protein